MSRHRLEPGPRVRARYGRMAAAGVSLAVTMVALLGGVGVLPLQSKSIADDDVALASDGSEDTKHADDSSAGAGASGATVEAPAHSRSQADRTVAGALEEVAAPETDNGYSTAVPPDSGEGRRVVFSKSAQRVWLVDTDESVESYLVSGSVTDNLAPGSYSVYSRSRWAVGVDDSGVMQYFVRFAHGPKAAIGFHSIPTKHGTPLQKVTQLGTPQSHGCIRQRLSDAERMWEFADVGTPVVVLA